MQPEYPTVPGQPYNPSGGAPGQPVSASQMKHHHPMLWMVISLVTVTLLMFGAAGFGFWAFSERNDFKNNVDSKIEAAVAKAVEESRAAQEKEFIEREKEPLQAYKGPAAFGALSIEYPKTWSAYVDEAQKGGKPIDGYFHPNFVPGVNSDTSFALHVEVLETDYDKELRKFDGASKKGTVKISAINAVNVPEVTGARVDGEIAKGKKGSIVLFPLRDKTIKLTVESEQFTKDFNEIILKKFTFTP